MGDPRRLKKKYEIPMRIWDAGRITEEDGLKKEYGLKNTRELWIARKVLRKIRREARRLLSLGERGKDGAMDLLASSVRLGFAKAGTTLDGLLALNMRDILERRLQTRVVKLGFAKTMNQARQLIAHGFIAVNGRKISVSSYTVPVSEERGIAFYKPIDLSTPEPKPRQLKRQGSTLEQLAPKEAPSTG